MGKPTGFMEFTRQVPADRVPEVLPPPPVTGPAPEPPPRQWRPPDEDPGRAAVLAWMNDGAELDPSLLAEAELSGLDLSGRDLRGWMLRGAIQGLRLNGQAYSEGQALRCGDELDTGAGEPLRLIEVLPG